MKRDRLNYFLIIGFVILVSLGFVSAFESQSGPDTSFNRGSGGNAAVDYIYEKVGGALAAIFAPIFNVEESSDFLFAKILLFIVVFALVYLALKQVKIFKKNNPSRIIVAIIVSVLAIRYLKESNIMRAILIPYGALGGSIAIFLPLIIYFFFVNTSIEGSFGRRFAWFLYGTILLFLWGTQEYMGSANWVYVAGLVFVLINLIFNKSIHRYFEMGKFYKIKKSIGKERAIELIDKIKKARNSELDDYADELEEKYKDLIKRVS